LVLVSFITRGSVFASRLVGAFDAAAELDAANGRKFEPGAAVAGDDVIQREPISSSTLQTATSLRPEWP
jgi:hypothetical protein